MRHPVLRQKFRIIFLKFDFTKMEAVTALLSNLTLPNTNEQILEDTNNENSVALENIQLSEIMKRSSLVDLIFCACNKDTVDKRIAFIDTISFIIGCSSVDWLVSSFKDTKPIKDIDTMLQKLYKCGLVPMFKDKEHYVYEKNDFPDTAARACSIINFTKAIVMKLMSDEPVAKDMIHNALLLMILKHSSIVLLQNYEEHLWTTKESVSLAKSTIDLICDLFHVKNIKSYLLISMSKNKENDARKFLRNDVLDLLLPSLKKDNWKQHPGIVQAFLHCVIYTNFPHLSDVLDKMLPPSLLFIDDYMNENKICGIHSLHHIVCNVTGEELRWYGRADVIYEALSHQLFSREIDILEVAIPANMAIVDVVDFSESKDSLIRPLTKRDQLLTKLLREAEGENIIALRRVYTKHLSAIINILGIGAVRHLPQIIKIATEYLEVYDGPIETSRFNVLNMLRTTIKVTWPRIPHYICDILKMLVKLLIDLAMDKTSSSDPVIKSLGEEAAKCLLLVKHIEDEAVLNYLICVVSTDIPESTKEIIQKVVDAELDGLS